MRDEIKRVYFRYCRKCQKLYKTYCKRGKICAECYGENTNKKELLRKYYPTINQEDRLIKLENSIGVSQ